MMPAARNRLKQAMERQNVSGGEIARYFGWNRHYVGRVIRGEVSAPSADRIGMICGYLGVSECWLIRGEDGVRNRGEIFARLARCSDEEIMQIAAYAERNRFI